MEFWVTNITNRDVSVGDLGLYIKAYQSVNLLDSRHYHYTLEQLEKSSTSGSLFRKHHMLKIRQVAPEVVKPTEILVHKGQPTPSRVARPIINVEIPRYEELEFSDEKFAQEDLDASFEDTMPILPKK